MNFDLSVVYVPGKHKVVADCLSRWGYLASKGLVDVSMHGDEQETADARRHIQMKRPMAEEGVKCFVDMASRTDYRDRMEGAVMKVMAKSVDICPFGACKATSSTSPKPKPASCLDEDWRDDYAESEEWWDYYKILSSPEDDQPWPKGPAEEGVKLFLHGKLLFPANRVQEPIQEWHVQMLHPSMVEQAQDTTGHDRVLRRVRKACPVCEACNPANHSLDEDEAWALIPEVAMALVSTDVFSMPKVTVGKSVYNCVVLVRDRQDAHIVAVSAK